MQPSLLRNLAFILITSSLAAAPARAVTGTWNLNPANGDWNIPSNWSSSAAPNGAADVATFGVSTITSVFLSANTEVDSIVFNPQASPYTITSAPTRTLTVSGAGIVNNSGVAQTLVAAGTDTSAASGLIQFTHNAALGSSTSFVSMGSSIYGQEGGSIEFHDTSSAGAGYLTVNGGAAPNGGAGHIRFLDASNAGHATLVSNGSVFLGSFLGATEFFGNSTAAQASIVNNGGSVAGFSSQPAFSGRVFFYDNASSAQATITNQGGAESYAAGGQASFLNNSTAATSVIVNNASAVDQGYSAGTGFGDNATAANSVIVNNGAVWGYDSGAKTSFYGSSSAGAATLIANNGPGGPLTGGQFEFGQNSTGGTARLEIFGNGLLNIANHDSLGMTIGSLEGDGTVFLGAKTLSIGSNGLNTEFSGVMRDGDPFRRIPGGGVTKVGSGTLTLSGQSLYSGLTTVNAGKLIINGSVVGQTVANGGTLAGSGSLRATTIASGATLSPGNGVGILHVTGALALNLGATYLVELDGATAGTQYSQTAVAGAVSIDGATLSLSLGFRAQPGMMFTIIDNDGTDPIGGIFADLSDGAIFAVEGQTFSISYQGGSGNDVVLTAVVPEPATWLLFSMGTLSLLVAHLGRRTTRFATITQMSGFRPPPQPAGRNRRQDVASTPTSSAGPASPFAVRWTRESTPSPRDRRKNVRLSLRIFV